MKINDVTEEDIKELADSSQILVRGIDYYKQGLVKSVQEDRGKITSQVIGNRTYDVTIWIEDNELKADCDCPYEGYGCKHIVATLYVWIKRKHQKSLIGSQETRSKEIDIKSHVNKLTREELAGMLYSLSEAHTEVKRDLTLKIVANSPGNATSCIDAILFQIKDELRNNELDYYNLPKVVSTLKKIKKSMMVVPAQMRMSVLETFISEGTKVIGRADDSEGTLGEFIINCLIDFGKALAEQDMPFDKKKPLLEKCLKLYEQESYGLEEGYHELLLNAAKTDEDYNLLIERTKEIIKKKRDKFDKELYHDFLIDLLKKSGREAEFLETVQTHLKDCRDYLRLAEFWREKGDLAKAVGIAAEGIKKRRDSWSNDSLFEFLEELYEKEGKSRELLDVQVLHFGESPSLVFYRKIKDLAEKLNLWKETQQSLYAFARPDILVRICLEENDYQKAINMAIEREDLPDTIKERVAKAVQLKYPMEAIKIYKSLVEKNIRHAVRDSYRVAAFYCKNIKIIYSKILDQEGAWLGYIERIKEAHKKKLALLQELRKVER